MGVYKTNPVPALGTIPYLKHLVFLCKYMLRVSGVPLLPVANSKRLPQLSRKQKKGISPVKKTVFVFDNAMVLKRTKTCQNTTFGYREIAHSLFFTEAIQHPGISVNIP